MRTWKPTIQSIYGLLGGGQRSSRALDDVMGGIQEAMLAALGPAGIRNFRGVSRRIQYATDLHALWYVRGDLMAALAELHGEVQASETIRSISAQFQGLLPKGLSSRPSPLGR